VGEKMRTKRTQAKTDPVLKRQLEAEKSDQELVQAVFTLRTSTLKTATPTNVEELTHEVLDRVADEIGIEAEEINIFRNLGAFAVSAPPNFIRALLTEPEIATATANQQQESMMIPPLKKRQVS
jgi:hypothetical protein